MGLNKATQKEEIFRRLNICDRVLDVSLNLGVETANFGPFENY